jgi:type VI protein secretion system component Hcp
MFVRRIVVALSAFVLPACPLAAGAAITTYLCISDPGFTGDVATSGYAGCSVVSAVGQTGFVDGAAVIARDIRIDKNIDSMSNPLRAAMVSGTTLSQVKIDFVTTSAATPTEFQTFRLLGVRVTSSAMSLDATDTMAETVSFMPAKIEFSFRKQNSTGQFGSPTYTCWDVVNQTATSAACP